MGLVSFSQLLRGILVYSGAVCSAAAAPVLFRADLGIVMNSFILLLGSLGR